MADSPLIIKSKEFALQIIKVCNYVKQTKKESVLTNQLIRSGTSVGANIREAFYGRSQKNFDFFYQYGKGKQMIIKAITASNEMWNKVKNHADSCSWKAGKSLANAMMNNGFKDWERVIVALNDDEICGYCTVAITDCIPDVHYTPYIGYLFVDEKWRGNRLSQRLIIWSIKYRKNIYC